MINIKANKINLLIILSLTFVLFFLYKHEISFKNIFKDEGINQNDNNDNNVLSIIVYFQNLTKNKNNFFNGIIQKLNSTRNFYFINTQEKFLNPKIISLIENKTIKIVQSNFPDSFYLPFVVSLYGQSIPEFVLFIEEKDITDNCENDLVKWFGIAYKKLKENEYDYIFGNSQIINGNKIGCSLLLVKASIIEHLLYYTDSDTSHINPFIQLSLATKTKFSFIQFDNIKSSGLINLNGKFSSNMNCPLIKDKENPSLCILLPNFKRNYLDYSFNAFLNQTYQPKFYLFIQNEFRLYYNLSLVQKKVDRPIYHIWMQNWNSFFFLNHRLASVIPCNFILKYDDDQWPSDNKLQENLINIAKDNNIIIGNRGFSVPKSYCGYSQKKYSNIRNNIVDHAAVPILMRPFYIKLEARNKIFRLFGGEDIALSLNSYKLCQVTSKKIRMPLIERQKDGNNQRRDKQIISAFKNEKKNNFDLFGNIYCYLIRSGYIPRRWVEFKIPKKHVLNILIKHKRLN
jgi:hypothetical protein